MEKVYAKKMFGQNFISDKSLIEKIINILGNEPESLVIEIGPGMGALTKELVKRFNKVVAIEIDTDMEEILKHEIRSDKFELIIKDALEVDLKQVINEYKKDNKNVFLISNMPYYITSEILFNTLKISKFLNKAVFMMQKEVATRVTANVNENNYNNLSIATKFYADTKYEFTVNKGMFRPVPKVDSAIISLNFYDKYINSIENDEKFVAMIRSLFNNKRKTILNNLSRYLNDKEKAHKILELANVKENLRPENITLEQFIDIYKVIEDE